MGIGQQGEKVAMRVGWRRGCLNDQGSKVLGYCEAVLRKGAALVARMYAGESGDGVVRVFSHRCAH